MRVERVVYLWEKKKKKKNKRTWDGKERNIVAALGSTICGVQLTRLGGIQKGQRRD